MILLRFSVVLLVSIFFVGLLSVIGLEIYYSSNLPRAANKQDGFVYKMTVNHGFVVYGTETEFQILKVSREYFPVACTCGLAAGLLNYKYSVFK
jgi:hypothetical protein